MIKRTALCFIVFLLHMSLLLFSCTGETAVPDSAPSGSANPETAAVDSLETEETTAAEPTESQKTLPVTVSLPDAYDTADLTYECEDGSILYTFGGKTEKDFTAVCDFYTGKDFRVYSSLNQEENRAVTFVGQSVMAHVYWTKYKQELNIVLSDNAADTLPPSVPEVTDGEFPCTVGQIEDTQNFIGMCYVIRLRDGSFLIYDGSFANQASKVLQYIRQNHEGEGKPVIRAWVLTHSHNDHYPVFEAFSNRESLRNQFILEHIIVSPLNDRNYTLDDVEEFYLSTKFWDDAALWEGTKVVFAHTGMKFSFCDLNMEILYAPESTYKYTRETGNFNNTTVVSRLYDDSYSALFLGDISTVGVDFLMNAYSEAYLKSNMCQVSHHGVEGSYILPFYDMVAPQILFYPASFALFDSTDTIYNPQVHKTLETRDYVKEILVHGVGQYTREWGTVFTDDAPVSIPDYEPRTTPVAELKIPDGAPLLSTDKTVYAVGEPIMATAYGNGNDWVGIVPNGETTPLRWWYLQPVRFSLNAWSGKAFDLTALPANTESTDPLIPGEYRVVLVRDGKTLEDTEAVTSIDITITAGDAESPAEEDSGLAPILHIPFDGSAEDIVGQASIRAVGKSAYTEGVDGQAAVVGSSYFALPGFDPGANSFTVMLWAKVSEITGDPALISTKNWESGNNPGFALGINGTENTHANIGDGFGNRVDIKPGLPEDFPDTWVHYTFTVDRTAQTMKVSYNFGEYHTVTIPAELVNAPYEGAGALIIGQDSTGKYTYGSMTCAVDDFMLFDRALTEDELTELSTRYGK